VNLPTGISENCNLVLWQDEQRTVQNGSFWYIVSHFCTVLRSFAQAQKVISLWRKGDCYFGVPKSKLAGVLTSRFGNLVLWQGEQRTVQNGSFWYMVAHFCTVLRSFVQAQKVASV
jgi:hypothetical protein